MAVNSDQVIVFTTSMMGKFRYLSDPQISPDGRTAAYTRYTAREEDGRFYSAAVLLDLSEDGTGPWRTAKSCEGRSCTVGDGENARSVKFLPDGSGFTFLSDESGELQLYRQTFTRMREGRKPQKLTSLRHGISRYELSGQSDAVLFEAKLWPSEIRDSLSFTEMTAREKKDWEHEREWAPQEITEIDYKKDEAYGVLDGSISCIGYLSLNGSDSEGAAQRLLTDDIPCERAQFSPDGRMAACYAWPHTGARRSAAELYLIDLEKGEKRCLSGNDLLCADAAPVFTEDGESVVYPAWYLKGDCSITYLYRRPVNGGEAVCLFDPEAEEVCSGVYGNPMMRTQYGEEKSYFTVVGEQVWFLSCWNGEEGLYCISLAGRSIPRPVLKGPFSVHEFCRPAAGRLLISRGDIYHVRDLWLYDAAPAEAAAENSFQNERQLTDENSWLSDVKQGKLKPLSVRSLDGKVMIHGWVCRPACFTEGRKYPAVLYLHGGPEVCYTNDFWHEVQALASAGFAVVYCDPRGSTGFGLDFADSEASWGKEAYEDLMHFLEEAVSLGFIDEKRLGITGGSYGGYMTCKIIMQDHRFAAAVGQRIFVNKATSYGTGDIGFYSARMSWDKVKIKDCLLQRSRTSIIRSMDRITTPLLLLHGYKDYRCSFEQAEQMFIAMRQRRKDVPVRLVMFPGENHNVSRSGLLHFQKRHVREMIDWFEKYLSGNGEREEKNGEGRRSDDETKQ